jgi:hypothetical protein
VADEHYHGGKHVNFSNFHLANIASDMSGRLIHVWRTPFEEDP